MPGRQVPCRAVTQRSPVPQAGEDKGKDTQWRARLQSGPQSKGVQHRPGRTDQRRWSSLNRSGRARPELLMRLALVRPKPYQLLPTLLPSRRITPDNCGQLWNINPVHDRSRTTLDDAPTPTDQMRGFRHGATQFVLDIVMDEAAGWYASGTFWAGAGAVAGILGAVAVVWVTLTVGFPRRRLFYRMQAVAPLMVAPEGVRAELELRHRGKLLTDLSAAPGSHGHISAAEQRPAHRLSRRPLVTFEQVPVHVLGDGDTGVTESLGDHM